MWHKYAMYFHIIGHKTKKLPIITYISKFNSYTSEINLCHLIPVKNIFIRLLVKLGPRWIIGISSLFSGHDRFLVGNDKYRHDRDYYHQHYDWVLPTVIIFGRLHHTSQQNINVPMSHRPEGLGWFYMPSTNKKISYILVDDRNDQNKLQSSQLLHKATHYYCSALSENSNMASPSL